MKACSKCKQQKDESEFYKNKSAPDGLLWQCKPCHRESMKATRKARPEQYRQKYSQWQDENRERQQRYDALYRERHPERKAESGVKFRAEHPEKWKAHGKVLRAARRGVLRYPEACQKCGNGGRIEASHDDYSRPLDVEFLCVKCHRRKDAARRVQARA